jgi:hypothetical protein
MKLTTWGKLLPTALLSSMIFSAQVQAQSYFKVTPVTFSLSKGSNSISKNITMYEYEKDLVLVQKVDRVVTVCLPPEQTDGWVDDSGKDYFQMPKAEKAQFLKDHVLGINKTADLVVEKCLKSKPRTYEAFKSEMESCGQKDSKLASLYNNVIVQNGEENRKALYPTLTPGNQCYNRVIYRWDLEERESQTGRSVSLNARIQLSKQADLLSFEKEEVTVNVNHSLRDGFFLTLGSSYYNNYVEISRSSEYGIVTLGITPVGRKQIKLSSSIAPVVLCNGGQKQIQLDGKDFPRLNEILGASNGSKVAVSYTDVKGIFNKPISKRWAYAEFNAQDLINGVWFRAITELNVKTGTKIKYNVSIEGSRHYAGKVEEVVKCY